MKEFVLLILPVLLALTLSGVRAGAAENPSGAAPAQAVKPGDKMDERLRLGEKMYREGILPGGRPVRTLVREGGGSAPGTTFACASCHLRSGLGGFEENVYSPPVNGPNLFRPLYSSYKGIEQGPRAAQALRLRPAYTDATLVAAIRGGKDPGGRVLSDVMPRYVLDDGEADILVAYLKSLSAAFSPGVTDKMIRFATVVTEEVPGEERQAMLSSLESYFRIMNGQVNAFRTPRGKKARQMAENMIGSSEATNRNVMLIPWVLKGPAETWRSQLEEYYRKEPVFALVSGISTGDWKTIHEFSEDHEIPCLFPNTRFPVLSERDRYTFYLSRGYYQEGESAARYLHSREELSKGKTVVEIVRDSDAGRALAAGFERAWSDLGQRPPKKVLLAPGEILDRGRLTKVLAGNRRAVLVAWDDARTLPALESLAGRSGRPAAVVASSGYLGGSLWTLNGSVRDFAYLTYPASFSPYTPPSGMGGRPPSDLKKTLRRAELPIRGAREQVRALTDATTLLLTTALMEMKGNYYRDHLLDVIGRMMPLQFPLYGIISFGPSDRYASKGCYIVQLTGGADPELVKRSDWEIH